MTFIKDKFKTKNKYAPVEIHHHYFYSILIKDCHDELYAENEDT